MRFVKLMPFHLIGLSLRKYNSILELVKMSFQKLRHNEVQIGSRRITFNKFNSIRDILEINDMIFFTTSPYEKDLDWSNPKTLDLWRDRIRKNPSQLFCYTSEGELKWTFPSDKVIGMGKIDVVSLTDKDFISPSHYKLFVEKYRNVALLEVDAGDFHYLVEAETGSLICKFSHLHLV